MASVHSHVRPNTWLLLLLHSSQLKLVEIKPNTLVEIPKFPSFSANLLLGRPYHHSYEVFERRQGETSSRLRVITAGELNAEVLAEDVSPAESRGDGTLQATENDGYDILAEDGTVVMKNNRLTVDDANRQALSQQDIEELKKSAGGKEIIEKILANHTGLEEKTSFSKAKYTLRKTRKYIKRFTVLPLDVGSLGQWLMQKESSRIMELREETMGLLMCWSNVHFNPPAETWAQAGGDYGGGNWLVIDETGGLVVAGMAEKMGMLWQDDEEDGEIQEDTSVEVDHIPTVTGGPDGSTDDEEVAGVSLNGFEERPAQVSKGQAKVQVNRDNPANDFPTPASTNTITLLHANVQPNISLLKYFGYDCNDPDTKHALHTHLKCLSWLQLLHPEEDPTYAEPDNVDLATLGNWKAGKRGQYFKKRRRWERCKVIVQSTKEGGFEGLVVATAMDPASVMPHVVPLVRGGGHIVVYSPTPEPLVKLVDLYSKERKLAYIQCLAKDEAPDPEDFPVDPRLLLAPTLQTSRVRSWQVLPGRTHPLMTGRGGAEGFVFTARRVLPVEGIVEARGNFTTRKRKAQVGSDGV